MLGATTAEERSLPPDIFRPQSPSDQLMARLSNALRLLLVGFQLMQSSHDLVAASIPGQGFWSHNIDPILHDMSLIVSRSLESCKIVVQQAMHCLGRPQASFETVVLVSMTNLGVDGGRAGKAEERSNIVRKVASQSRSKALLCGDRLTREADLKQVVPEFIVAISRKNDWRFAQQQILEPGGVCLAWQMQEIPAQPFS